MHRIHARTHACIFSRPSLCYQLTTHLRRKKTDSSHKSKSRSNQTEARKKEQVFDHVFVHMHNTLFWIFFSGLLQALSVCLSAYYSLCYANYCLVSLRSLAIGGPGQARLFVFQSKCFHWHYTPVTAERLSIPPTWLAFQILHVQLI